MDGLIDARANAGWWYLDRHLEDGRAAWTCLKSEEGNLSYGDLADLAGRVANVLIEAGLRIEDRVLLVLPDSPLLVATILGAMRVGAVPVPLSTRLTSVDYAYVAADCRPRVAVVAPEYIGALVASSRNSGYPSVIFCTSSGEPPSPGPAHVSGAHSEDGARVEPLEPLLETASAECPFAPTSRDDMAVIQYTSGSTGTPKGVVHLHRGLLALPGGFGRMLDLTPRDLCFSAVKISVGYGMGNSIFFPLAAGAGSFVHPGTTDPLAVIDVVQKCRPSVFFGVPSLYAALLALAESTIAETFAGVRLCVSAGEFLDSSVRDGWRQRAGLQILDGLGSTECLHIFITSRPRDSGGESAGEVVEGIEARLLDEGEQEVGPGEIGHLWVKSPANAARYWNKHDESMATMHGPWTRTGDELLQDEGGFFHYVGRSDDIIEVGGMKVAPAEVEVALLQHPAVEQCAVVGTWEEGKSTVIAYVCLADDHEGDPATTRSLHHHARQALAGYKRPRQYIYVDSLPTTSTGTLARFRLRDAARQRTSGDPTTG
jgi:benzoate-CoA ligase family protein